ncbi:Hypothetical protein PHPALM_36982 [Phytophthora palmivora]|uniref:Uncharacterized protein n=1 Tax=Phytophthora palmivora TaxID=4796 RepID=A0A2P4WYK7_9STRA|nr:Hypothetical protein PHPALM_36982 [Phytophthora palmivora]
MMEGYPNNVRPPTVSMLIDSSLESMTVGNAVVIDNSELFEEIYSSAIHHFFPMVTYSVLGQYLQDESKVEYLFDRHDALEQFHKQAKRINAVVVEVFHAAPP